MIALPVQWRFALGLGALLVAFLTPRAAAAYTIQAPEIKRFSQDGIQEETFFGFDEKFSGGARIAAGDLDGDGSDEVVVGAGPGGGPNVRIFERDGTYRGSFMAYDPGFRGGIFVAAGDIDGDGVAEIITGPGTRGGPEVRVFSENGQRRARFMAYDTSFRGGVFVAAGDLTGDGRDEIITGSGPGGRSHVRVFNGDGQYLGLDFWPFAAEHIGGVAVAAGDVAGDTRQEIVMSVFSAGNAAVKVYGYETARPIFGDFTAFAGGRVAGVTVATVNVVGDAKDEILVAPTNGGPQVLPYTVDGTRAAGGFFPFPRDYRGGVYLAGMRSSGGRDEVLTAPGNGLTRNRPDLSLYIEVALSEQRLYAYEYGVLVKTFLISTGLPGWDTPTGTYHVSAKIPVKLYAGPGYYLPNTKWNLRYDGPRYLHGAYWHNQFGRRKSHGCINIAYPNAEWLYGWASVGTTVVVKA